MEYGGITPIGLPEGWRLLVDARCVDIDVALIGSGVRRSKLLLPEPTWAGSRAPRWSRDSRGSHVSGPAMSPVGGHVRMDTLLRDIPGKNPRRRPSPF
jgi:hypothetical protein